jgi:hypothetical protein
MKGIMLKGVGFAVLTICIFLLTGSGKSDRSVQEKESNNILRINEDIQSPKILGGGGPDQFGYFWTDTIPYNWVDITGVGTSISLGDDDGIRVPLGFSFNFYGISHDSVAISSNGYLTFGPDTAAVGYNCVPTEVVPNNAIFLFWTDLDPTSAGSIYYYTTPANDSFIVSYHGVVEFNGFPEDTVTLQAILESNGNITYQYQHFGPGVEIVFMSVGIENSDGNDGLSVACEIPYISDNLAVQFYLIDDVIITNLRKPNLFTPPQVMTNIEASIRSSPIASLYSDFDLYCIIDSVGIPVYQDSIHVDSLLPNTILPVTFSLPWTPGPKGSQYSLNIFHTAQDSNPFNDTLYHFIRTECGQDGFGYDCTPILFNWIDISSVGTPITLMDDNGVRVSILYNFDFYGFPYSSVSISSNGYLTFGTEPGDWSNDCIPNALSPNNSMFLFWDDLDPGDGRGSVYYWTNATRDTFIVTYEGIPEWPGENGDTITAQVILDANGVITYQYRYFDPYMDLLSSTVGIENPLGSDGVGTICIGHGLGNELALQYLPPTVGIEESNDEYRTRNLEFRLFKNQPNPFNRLTALSYELGAQAHTTLRIYDISGRLVKTLVDAHQKPGVYQIPVTSNQLPGSGIYFYRLQSGDFISSKKLILLR